MHYLVVPRFLACVLLIPLLAILGDFAGVMGGALICTQVYHVESYHYWLHARVFIGMVLAVQSYIEFYQIGLATHLGAIINLSVVRELGPVLAATMLAGRVGSAMAAELATMRVT